MIDFPFIFGDGMIAGFRIDSGYMKEFLVFFQRVQGRVQHIQTLESLMSRFYDRIMQRWVIQCVVHFFRELIPMTLHVVLIAGIVAAA